MPTEPTNVAQERILQAVKASQDASVQAVRSWAEAVATVVPRVPELVYPDRPDYAFEFASKLWASQVEFLTKVVDAATGPLVGTVHEAARNAGPRVAAASGAKA
ncbi:MAG: hypothetical protein ACRD12_24445 [Acidimicrobiales bacterium]